MTAGDRSVGDRPLVVICRAPPRRYAFARRFRDRAVGGCDGCARVRREPGEIPIRPLAVTMGVSAT